jgi:hypothetical protein
MAAIRSFFVALRRALWWTLLLSTGWVGIGGMSLGSASDAAIKRLWEAAALIAGVTFIVVFTTFLLRSGSTNIRRTD